MAMLQTGSNASSKGSCEQQATSRTRNECAGRLEVSSNLGGTCWVKIRPLAVHRDAEQEGPGSSLYRTFVAEVTLYRSCAIEDCAWGGPRSPRNSFARTSVINALFVCTLGLGPQLYAPATDMIFLRDLGDLASKYDVKHYSFWSKCHLKQAVCIKVRVHRCAANWT